MPSPPERSGTSEVVSENPAGNRAEARESPKVGSPDLSIGARRPGAFLPPEGPRRARRTLRRAEVEIWGRKRTYWDFPAFPYLRGGLALEPPPACLGLPVFFPPAPFLFPLPEPGVVASVWVSGKEAEAVAAGWA